MEYVYCMICQMYILKERLLIILSIKNISKSFEKCEHKNHDSTITNVIVMSIYLYINNKILIRKLYNSLPEKVNT